MVFLSGSLPPSNRLIELVESRIQGLSGEERHVLDLLAFAEGLGANVLTALTDPLRLQELERRGLVVVTRDRRRIEARVAHPIHSDVLRHRAGVMKAEGVKRALADALESTGARREDLLRLGAWRLEAGGEVNAHLMLRAAGQARARCDYDLAERLLSAAIDVGAGIEAALLSGQLLYLQGRSEEAEDRLAPLAGQLTNDLDRGRLAASGWTTSGTAWAGGTRRFGSAEEAEAVIADEGIRDIVTARRAGALGGGDHRRAALDRSSPSWPMPPGRRCRGPARSGP